MLEKLWKSCDTHHATFCEDDRCAKAHLNAQVMGVRNSCFFPLVRIRKESKVALVPRGRRSRRPEAAPGVCLVPAKRLRLRKRDEADTGRRVLMAVSAGKGTPSTGSGLGGLVFGPDSRDTPTGRFGYSGSRLGGFLDGAKRSFAELWKGRAQAWRGSSPRGRVALFGESLGLEGEVARGAQKPALGLEARVRRKLRISLGTLFFVRYLLQPENRLSPSRRIRLVLGPKIKHTRGIEDQDFQDPPGSPALRHCAP